jgi:hypothetical protein
MYYTGDPDVTEDDIRRYTNIGNQMANAKPSQQPNYTEPDMNGHVRQPEPLFQPHPQSHPQSQDTFTYLQSQRSAYNPRLNKVKRR